MPLTQPKPFVFVLMPFAEEFDDVYKLGIKPACEKAGAYAERVDEQVFQGSIPERIYNQIAKADLIVADMTGRNPNVFYEVGYAHALAKTVIHLTQRSTDIPFDLKPYPHIVYGKKISDLIPKLEKHLAVHLSSGETGRIPTGSALRFFWKGDELRDGSSCILDVRQLPARTLTLAFDIHNQVATAIETAEFQVGLLCPPQFDHCRGALIGLDNKRLYLNKIQQPDGRSLFLLPHQVVLTPDAWATVLFEPLAKDPGLEAGDQPAMTLRVFAKTGTTSLVFTPTIQLEDDDD